MDNYAKLGKRLQETVEYLSKVATIPLINFPLSRSIKDGIRSIIGFGDVGAYISPFSTINQPT